MRWRFFWLSLVMPLVLATSMTLASAPVQAAQTQGQPPVGKIHDLSHPVYHVSAFLGLTAAPGPGKHPTAAFPGAFCRNDTAYFLPFYGIGRWYGYSLSQGDGLLNAQMWYLWCPAADSRAAPYGFNFSGGRITSADGQCHTITLGMPMDTDYTDIAGHEHTVASYSGSTLLQSGATSTTSADWRSARTICPWSPLTTWSGVANARYSYISMLNVFIQLSSDSATGFFLQSPLFE